MHPALLPAVCVLYAGSGPAQTRPTLSGSELVRLSADGVFKIHYTFSGADAIAAADVSPANGVPDFVDWIEAGLARMRTAFVVGDGWPAIPLDEGLGGDDRLDVYVRVIGANGYAHVEILPSG